MAKIVRYPIRVKGKLKEKFSLKIKSLVPFTHFRHAYKLLVMPPLFVVGTHTSATHDFL